MFHLAYLAEQQGFEYDCSHYNPGKEIRMIYVPPQAEPSFPKGFEEMKEVSPGHLFIDEYPYHQDEWIYADNPTDLKNTYQQKIEWRKQSDNGYFLPVPDWLELFVQIRKRLFGGRGGAYDTVDRHFNPFLPQMQVENITQIDWAEL